MASADDERNLELTGSVDSHGDFAAAVTVLAVTMIDTTFLAFGRSPAEDGGAAEPALVADMK